MNNDRYVSPLSERYASDEMQYVFSADNKFKTWRKLWIALADAERELGLPITKQQVDELKEHANDINYDVAKKREEQVRHDVMAHVYAYGEQCPNAKGIIHLGATSCYVCDNTDIIVMKQGLEIIKNKLVNVIASLSSFAEQYKSMPALAYTHLQPAQLTTVGKRATLWINDLIMDYDELVYRIDSLKLLGSKGTTGTQASFMELFNGDSKKIVALEDKIAKSMGFNEYVSVSGQTYSRKVDSNILATLSAVAQSAYKFSNDMRILQNFKEMEEPFETNQIGSSAMPYKRNPMRSERMSSLARYVIVDALNPAITASTQWFERTLDDSANKRISVAEAFLAVDAILNIYINISSGIVVYPKVIHQRIMKELPFMATENIMMSAVKKGGDRQQLHEKIRKHSIKAAANVKQNGLENDLIERIVADDSFMLTKEELTHVLKPENFIGRSVEQVESFIKNDVTPILEKNADIIGYKSVLKV
ncbi:MAG: adenylosuccinate lyase [Clostridia bacterium]